MFANVCMYVCVYIRSVVLIGFLYYPLSLESRFFIPDCVCLANKPYRASPTVGDNLSKLSVLILLIGSHVPGSLN